MARSLLRFDCDAFHAVITFVAAHSHALPVLIRAVQYAAAEFDAFIHDGGVRILVAAVAVVKFALEGLEMIQRIQIFLHGEGTRQVQQRVGVAGVARETDAGLAVEQHNLARRMAADMKDGDILVLQNTRFRPEETKNDPAFSRELASLAEVYVDDAFGSAHRAHCSTVGVTDYIRETAVGYLMEKEINYLGNAVEQPVRPLVAILGGAKVADKLKVINNLLDKVDTLIIGGGMAYTFLAAKGFEVGTSLLDAEKIDYCKEMMAKAEKNGVKLVLPVDTVTTAQFPNPIDAPIETLTVDSDKIPADRMGMDIGPKTRALYAEAVKDAKTVVWNGPMGVFENPVLAEGTIAVAKALAETDATTIIGGGDSAAAVQQLGFGDKMSHISTGGGASLEYLEGTLLPGIACIRDK